MLSGLSLPMLALLMTAGVLLDLILGETRRWHPRWSALAASPARSNAC